MTFMMVAMHVITMVALMTMTMHHPGLYGRAVVAVWLSLAVLFGGLFDGCGWVRGHRPKILFIP